MEKGKYTYEYPHYAVASDCIVFGYDGKELHVLLIERSDKTGWALPGGFMQSNESAEECAIRELQEETGVSNVYLENFGTYTEVERDPRERVISIAFFALVRKGDFHIVADTDAANAKWWKINNVPSLAFDHNQIVKDAFESLRIRLATDPIAFKLFDEKFKMSELQNLYEIINEKQYDRRNFAKKMLDTGFVKEHAIEGLSRSRLYSFDSDSYEKRDKTKRFPFNF